MLSELLRTNGSFVIETAWRRAAPLPPNRCDQETVCKFSNIPASRFSRALHGRNRPHGSGPHSSGSSRKGSLPSPATSGSGLKVGPSTKPRSMTIGNLSSSMAGRPIAPTITLADGSGAVKRQRRASLSTNLRADVEADG
jgi:hypothetical protein